MKTYDVLVPITGVICVSVKAESEKEAIAAAFESDDLTLENVQEWEPHKQIVRGNVFYGTQNAVEIAESYDDEEDEE